MDQFGAGGEGKAECSGSEALAGLAGYECPDEEADVSDSGDAHFAAAASAGDGAKGATNKNWR